MTELFGCEFRTGRPNAAPELKRANTQKDGKAHLVDKPLKQDASGVQSSTAHVSELRGHHGSSELFLEGHKDKLDSGTEAPSRGPRAIRLPHLFPKDAIGQEYVAAIPEEERAGEPDHTPKAELEDFVPKF